MSQNTILIIVIVLQQGLFGLLWLVLAKMRLSRKPTLHWAVCMFLVSLGLSLVVQRASLPPWLGYWVANACVLGGFTLARRGVEIFAYKRPADLEHVGVWLLALGVMASLDLSKATAFMVVISSATQAWILGRTGTVIWRDLCGEFGAKMARGIAAVVLFLACTLVVRAMVAALRPAALGHSIHADQLANTYTVLAFLTAGLILNLGLVGLVMSRMLSRLQKLSENDALTGLLNRGAIEGRVRDESERLLRYNEPFALLAFDVDHFKTVNDEFGHPAGDAVLRELGKVARAACRQTDLAGRSGGEEFWLVLPHTRQAGALPMAQRLLEAVQSLEVKELQGKRRLSVSIGLAVSETPGESHESLLQRVDKALYRAKREGRNRIVVAEPAPGGGVTAASSPRVAA